MFDPAFSPEMKQFSSGQWYPWGTFAGMRRLFAHLYHTGLSDWGLSFVNTRGTRSLLTGGRHVVAVSDVDEQVFSIITGTLDKGHLKQRVIRWVLAVTLTAVSHQ